MPERNIEFFYEGLHPMPEADTVIIGIDPGVTTGVSVLGFNSENIPLPQEVTLWGSDQISYGGSGNAKDLLESEGGFVEQKIARKIGDAIKTLGYDRKIVVVIEDFVIRQQNSTRDFLAPVRITAGILQEIHEDENTRVIFQTPADAKSICKDERMDKWGYRIQTQKDRHSRDADRHAILCLRRIMEKPQLLRGLSSR